MSNQKLCHFKITCDNCPKQVIALLPAPYKSIYGSHAPEILKDWSRLEHKRWDDRNDVWVLSGVYKDFCPDCVNVSIKESENNESVQLKINSSNKDDYKCLTEI